MKGIFLSAMMLALGLCAGATATPTFGDQGRSLIVAGVSSGGTGTG